MMNGIAIFFSIVFLSCGYGTGYELSLANKEAELNQRYDRDPSVSQENRTPANITNTDSNTFNQNTPTEPCDPVNLSWQEINESDDPEGYHDLIKNIKISFNCWNAVPYPIANLATAPFEFAFLPNSASNEVKVASENYPLYGDSWIKEKDKVLKKIHWIQSENRTISPKDIEYANKARDDFNETLKELKINKIDENCYYSPIFQEKETKLLKKSALNQKSIFSKDHPYLVRFRLDPNSKISEEQKQLFFSDKKICHYLKETHPMIHKEGELSITDFCKKPEKIFNFLDKIEKKWTEHVLKNSDNSTINKILNGQQNLESLFDSSNIPTDWKIAVATTPETINGKLIMPKNTSHFDVDWDLVIAALTRYREWGTDDAISNISIMGLYRELETAEIQLEYALLNEAFFQNNEETLEKLGEILGLIRYSSDCPQEDKNKAQNIRRSFQTLVNSQKESSDFYYVPFFTKEDFQKLLNVVRFKETNLREGKYLIRFKFSETKKENSSDSQTITIPTKENSSNSQTITVPTDVNLSLCLIL
jgi:hypothetical protein